MRDLAVVAAIIGSAIALPATSSADPLNAVGRTIDLPVTPMDVRIQYGSSHPGSTDLVGEGSLGANLPGDGRLTIRVPHTLGERSIFGESHLAVGYDLLHEGDFMPKLAVTTQVALPTARGARGVQPGVKARATKKLHLGVIREVHAETELATQGRELARSYRATLGTSLKLEPETTASFDFVSTVPAPGAGARDNSAQLGLSHTLGKHSSLHLGFGAGVLSTGQASLRSTVGIDLHF
ncbi:MAG TPA: hypothetical protein VMR50_13160 [Myxococcota bacterium]|nr:hypothetical protein [Myxococcota bacterium]